MKLTGYEAALEIKDLLFAAGYACVIAGGAARDTHLGLTPKDYDLVMLGDNESMEVLDAIRCEDYTVNTYGIDDDAYTGSGDSAPSHLSWVIKVGVAGHTVDVIQQAHRPRCAESAVEGFDVTLNMAWFKNDGTVALHSRFPEPGGEVHILRTCDFPATRIPYLAAKHPGYIWPTLTQGH